MHSSRRWEAFIIPVFFMSCACEGTGVLRREKIDHGWMASGVEDVGTTYREARASSLRKADGVAVAVVAVGWYWQNTRI